MKRFRLLVVNLLLVVGAGAQTPIRIVDTGTDILMATIDRPGDLYVVETNGHMTRFDKDGNPMASRQDTIPPTIFEARDGARLFSYYRPAQQFHFLNPSLEPRGSFDVDPALAIEPWLMCTSGDRSLWLFDKADNSLKKLNTAQTEVETEVILDSLLAGRVSDFAMVRDYQGFLFALNPEKGILIFNGLGRHLRTIEAPGVSGFNFLGEELYYVQGQRIKLFDLFNTETRELPLPTAAGMVLLTDERMFIIHSRSVAIYSFPSN